VASISQIVDLLAQASEPAATLAEPTLPCEALTRCEARVLRYLPTHLSTREIAGELNLSATRCSTNCGGSTARYAGLTGDPGPPRRRRYPAGVVR
jgi:hypothetical protein